MAHTIVMVSPDHFGFNPETAVSNAFQKNSAIIDAREKALGEFINVVAAIRNKGITVLTFASPKNYLCPDAVFPNNWFSTHSDGTLVIYPMLTPNRRAERNPEIISYLENHFAVSRKIELQEEENSGHILEGTGSIVFDHQHRLAYACISSRTDEKLLNKLCDQLHYQPVVFEAFGPTGEPVYHTNVVMAVGKKYVVICLESIENILERNLIKEQIKRTGKDLIEIDFSQMLRFAGNMLEVENQEGESFLILSETAFQALNPEQKEKINQYSNLLPINIPTIETIGGGSARCMMAEIFLRPN